MPGNPTHNSTLSQHITWPLLEGFPALSKPSRDQAAYVHTQQPSLPLPVRAGIMGCHSNFTALHRACACSYWLLSQAHQCMLHSLASSH